MRLRGVGWCALIASLALEGCARAPSKRSTWKLPPGCTEECKAYCQRIKDAVSTIWTTLILREAAARDPTGKIHSYRDRRTVLEFTLDAEGAVSDVRIVNSSDVEYIDRVAVEAFEKAAKFDPPPRALLDAAGTVRLPFAFTLQAARGGVRAP